MRNVQLSPRGQRWPKFISQPIEPAFSKYRIRHVEPDILIRILFPQKKHVLDIRIRLKTYYPAGYPSGKPDSDHLCYLNAETSSVSSVFIARGYLRSNAQNRHPFHHLPFRRCSWNRLDMIIFNVVRKITASRENRRELLGDEVMKTASHRNCTIRGTSIEFEQLLYRAGNGSWFLRCKSLGFLLAENRLVSIINQSVLCSTIKQSVKYEDFVSRNLWTVVYCNAPNCNCNLFHKFLWHILCYSISSILNWGKHSHIGI